MAKYTIYDTDGGKPTNIKAVKVGWNFSALIFGPFWTLYHKLWGYFVISILALLFGLGLGIYIDKIYLIFIVWVMIHIDLSWHGNEDYLPDALRKAFYREAISDLIEADSADEAARKYIREQAKAEQSEEQD